LEPPKAKETSITASVDLLILAASLFTFFAWRFRLFGFIRPHLPLGYSLGICGTFFMAALFIYSFRKRLNSWDKIGSTRAWFKIHMLLGILGPIFILFHSNFSLGSVNSNVAVFSMLLVALSGVFGRYIYGKIHYDLYGELANLKELKNKLNQEKEEVQLQFAQIPGVKEELFLFADNNSNLSFDLTNSALRFFTIRWKAHRAYLKSRSLLLANIDHNAPVYNWGHFVKKLKKKQLEKQIKGFLNQSIRIAEFNLYERLFSFWHMLHIPFVFILFLAVAMHIIAINRY